MNRPRVSICIATYNHERYLFNCIMSVVTQASDVPLEILIGDDHSDDLTEEIVRRLAERYPDLIRYFRYDNRMGGEWNYQFLIGQARGEYIAHLDGDDFWLPGKLVAQLAILDTSPLCVAVYSNAICVNNEGALLGLFNNPLPERFDLNSLLRRGNFLNHSSLIYRAEFSEFIRGWPPDFIDYRIHLNLARYGQLGYLRSPYVGYRINSTGSAIAQQGGRVRELYWSAVLEALSLTNDRDLKMAVVADFLSGIFFHAIGIDNFDIFVKWWQVVMQQFPCSKVHLAIRVAMVVVRRGTLSLLTRHFGRMAGLPFRIFHRR